MPYSDLLCLPLLSQSQGRHCQPKAFAQLLWRHDSGTMLSVVHREQIQITISVDGVPRKAPQDTAVLSYVSRSEVGDFTHNHTLLMQADL